MKTKKRIIYITACFLSIFIICVWSAKVIAADKYSLDDAIYEESVSVFTKNECGAGGYHITGFMTDII